MEQVLSHARNLLQQGQYDSVELLGHFLISSKNTTVEAFVLFADALYGNSHFPRAMHYFKQALAMVNPRTNASTIETELFLKIGNCYTKLKDDPSAISWLEKIPAAQRTLSINMQLARLHHSNGAKVASVYYKDALKQNPYAMEAIYALITLGEDAENLSSFLDTSITSPSSSLSSSSSLPTPQDKPHTRTWLGLNSLAFGALFSQTVTKALPLYNKLIQQFPSNLHLMDQLGQCHALMEDEQKALWLLQNVIHHDPFHESSMDLYAMLLRSQHNLLELNRVGHALVRSSSGSRDSPQCWTVLALYSAAKGQRERAGELLDKAISHAHAMASRSGAPIYSGSLARAYIAKSELLLQSQLPEQAVVMCRRAHLLSHGSLRSCQGLVTSHLALGQLKEAHRYASEASRRWTNSARASTLLGLVLMQTPESRPKAKKILTDALSHSPSCTDALLALANLLSLEGKYPEALELLKNHMKVAKSELVYIQIGEVCTQMKNYDEALAHYHLALALNPASEAAQKAIVRVDMLMKGKDPDAPEGEEDEEEEEEEEEEDDGGELEEDDEDQDMLE